jgi:hypothetical protein
MNIFKKVFIILFLIIICLLAKTDGTTGLPLGGIGTGAVKFAGGSGTFAANFRTPTRDGDYDPLSETHFQIFIQRGDSILTDDLLEAYQTGGRVDDDAIFPLHRVNFGEMNDVSVEMTAYMPYYPDSLPMMLHPCAMFEFEVENLESDSVTVALAFQIETPAVPAAIPDTGFTANDASLELCLIGDFPENTSVISYGNDNGFFTDGLCDNNLSGTTNRLALRVNLASVETKRARFVLSWYQPDEEEHYRYTNYWGNAKEAGISALINFDAFKNIDEELVNRMRNSNLPGWLVDQTLNSLANLVNNSVYFQDGRYCHTEGMWHPEGTMDQMWHARQIYTMINPELAWRELEWWARTQHVDNYTGQIHHDFGTYFNYVGWDDTEHEDYRPIYEWVDLNCGFIISVYEAFIATEDINELTYFWDPYVKRAGQRILDQVGLYGSLEYPYTFANSLSTYDAGGNSQAYNTGLSVVTYQIMINLAGIMSEPDVINLYQAALDTVITNFESRWMDNTYPTGNYCESVLGGLWIANYLKMDPFWQKEKLNVLYNTIINYYDPLNRGIGSSSYSEWQPYLVGHLGGYSLQTCKDNMWWALQKDMYDRNYLNRNLVFNQQLGIPGEVSSPAWIATSTSGDDQYISIPVLWRNYYNIAGYHYNKYSGELWLEPMLFDSLNHRLEDVLVITPAGYATMNYEAYGEFNQNQEIVFTPDQAVDVSAIYVWDLYSDSLNSIDFVRVEGLETDYTRTGSGDLAQLKLDWSGTITTAGLTIQIEGEAKPGLGIPDPPENLQAEVLNSSQVLLSWNSVQGDIMGYTIEVNVDGVFRTLSTTTDTFYLETGLLKNTSYAYRVCSYNEGNSSSPSVEIDVTTADGGNGEIVYAINAGGNTYQSSASGIEYLDDETTGWLSGGDSYSVTDAIGGTTDDTLYQTERYGDFGFAIPIDNASYDVVLKFAEIYQDNPGARVFDVEMEEERVIRNLDLIFRTDKYTAYDVVMPVEVIDGELNIDFITVANNAKLSTLEVREEGAGVKDPAKIPSKYFLSQNYPNPFNLSTSIQYGLPKTSQVQINIYNVSGQKVDFIVNEKQKAGYYSVDFNAESLSGGIYFYKIEADGFSRTKKMVLAK